MDGIWTLTEVAGQAAPLLLSLHPMQTVRRRACGARRRTGALRLKRLHDAPEEGNERLHPA
ncbi:hypothetical protein GXW74_12370 [Roseomonas eburnea]|uniref:Uncharacterized protein n=1 Tax=Neoroseomonas eburnea TaxID=1346889 RepID=A0A9X9XC46_9PROT|nr:hypothetical protein [Neoroseomonas eburnea]MBR0681282.1 hypothetical protein [Neoroseomonas eburnea]